MAAGARAAIRHGGRDVVAEKRQAKAAAVTIRQAAVTMHESHKSQWANEKHADQWLTTLETYAFPALGARPVGEINARDIIPAMIDVWNVKPETGRRVRQRICAVLDFAHARGWRATEAPARSLAVGKGLPRQPGGRYHPALPHADVPESTQHLTVIRTLHGMWAERSERNGR